MEKELEERAREFLKHEDGVLGDVYQIMAAFAAQVQSEREKATIEVLRGYELSHAQRMSNRSEGRTDYCACYLCAKARPMFILATPPGA